MQKVTKLPIGLGMNHTEQEIAACQLWNTIIESGKDATAWMPVEGRDPDLFSTNWESGRSLLGSGFIEVSGDSVRLTQKAVDLIEKFVSEQ